MAMQKDEALLTPRPAVEALVKAAHGDPFAVLGPHAVPGEGVAVRVLQPHAERVAVIDPADGRTIIELRKTHADGFFEGTIRDGRLSFRYRLRLTFHDGAVVEIRRSLSVPACPRRARHPSARRGHASADLHRGSARTR